MVALLAPTVYVSITIEQAEGGDDIRVHAGGHGIWVARMLRHLDHRPVACAPVGGETGRTLLELVADWAIDVHAVETLTETAAYVHDRRNGDALDAFLEGGSISALKISSDDLVEDGRLDEDRGDAAVDQVVADIETR